MSLINIRQYSSYFKTDMKYLIEFTIPKPKEVCRGYYSISF